MAIPPLGADEEKGGTGGVEDEEEWGGCIEEHY